MAAQLTLTVAAVGLLARPLAYTLQGGAACSVAWFARCVFAEMLGSHAIMFVVRPAPSHSQAVDSALGFCAASNTD